VKPRFSPRYGGGRFAGVSNAISIEDVVRTVAKINRRVRHERRQATADEREAHLRGLLGLPATPAVRDREAAR
jgi:hypothetical protein